MAGGGALVDELAGGGLGVGGRLADPPGELFEAVAEADARVAEWTAQPDVDAALDYYAEINGRLAKARGAAEVNAVLRELLGGAWIDVRGDLIVVNFVLRADERSLVRPAPLHRIRRPSKPDQRHWCGE